MAGGKWDPTQPPVLPGLYLNFQAAAVAAITGGERGIVVMPVKAKWGPATTFVEITSETELIENFTESTADGATAYTCGRLCLLGNPHKLLLYRLTDANAAKATKTLQDTTGAPVNVVRLDSKYPTTRDFRVTTQDNALDSNNQDLKLYEGTTLLYTFTYAKGNVDNVIAAVNVAANKWVDAVKLAAGNGTLATIANSAFAGGNDGIAAIANADYTAALTAFETQQFDVLALDGATDASLQTSVKAWVQRVRGEGMGIVAVLGGTNTVDTAADAVAQTNTRSTGFNFEGVINVGDGATMDGVTYPSAQVACWVAGARASIKLTESLTYKQAPFDDVTRRWTRSEQEAAINNGTLLLVHDGRQVKILRGINTLTTLGAGQNALWKKDRFITVIDTFNRDLLQSAEDYYIGKVNNTEEGRLALIGACKAYLKTHAQAGVIDDVYDVIVDPAYPNPAADQVYLKWTAKPTDVMEQIFGTFIVE